LEATKKTLTQVKEDKESLSHKIKGLENDNTSCKHDKETCENQKKKEIQDSREILQGREREIITKNEKIDQLKLDNNNVDKKKVIELAQKNDFLERDIESLIGTVDVIGDKNFENSNLQNIARSEKAKGKERYLNFTRKFHFYQIYEQINQVIQYFRPQIRNNV